MSNDKDKIKKLIDDLQREGYPICDFNELSGLKKKHYNLVPILLKYIDEFEDTNLKEGLIRALGVSGFNNATQKLLQEFRTTNNRSYKWAIGNSISLILDSRYEDEYIEIIQDKKNSTARQMVVVTLGKLRSEKSLSTLIQLLNDIDVVGHVIIALGYYNNSQLIKYVEPFLTHEKTWIKKEAEKSITKLSNK